MQRTLQINLINTASTTVSETLVTFPKAQTKHFFLDHTVGINILLYHLQMYGRRIYNFSTATKHLL